MARTELPPPVARLERMHRQLQQDQQVAELRAAAMAEEARKALEARNYSGAATWCHRAHQAVLQAQVLQGVLDA